METIITQSGNDVTCDLKEAEIGTIMAKHPPPCALKPRITIIKPSTFIKEGIKMAQKILICDDHPSSMKRLAFTLKTKGFEHISHGWCRVAFPCKYRKADMILLDLMMPKVSGIEVCERYA